MPSTPVTITNCTADVILWLGNRQDLATRVLDWLVSSYQDIGMSYPFAELEDTITDSFVANIDVYQYPSTARGIKAVTGVRSDGSTFPVRRKDIRVVRRYPNNIPGVPSIYASFGAAGGLRNIIVRPTPNDTFTLLWDIWVLPFIAAPIGDTQILLPDDWIEILKWMAVLRGHMALFERDKAGEVHTLLYGDPTELNSPGLIKQKLLQHSAESVASEYGVRPIIRAYTSSGS